MIKNKINLYGRLSCIMKIFIPCILLLLSVSCSSLKDTGDIVDIRLLTEKELDLGNKEAGRGKFDTALYLLQECKRRAILVDDASLMIRSSLSLGNVLFSLGRTDEAFAEWENAVSMAEKINNTELLSISRIFLARGNLISKRMPSQAVLDAVTREAVNIKSDRLYIAFSWQVRALAQSDLRLYREAEDSAGRSLAIHVRETYLENASYDWYLIASIRSLAGNTAGAIQALENSIMYDRRVENSWGLASAWRATGDVHNKAGNNAEAREAYLRSKAIFHAMGNISEAAEIDRRMDGL